MLEYHKSSHTISLPLHRYPLMTSTNFKLLLQFHCDQDIDAMPLKENGSKRYCGQCDRNIVDFRNYSMEEVLQYKKSLNGEKFCGIYRSECVRPEVVISPRFESRRNIFSNSLMILAALSLLTACQTNESSERTLGEPIEESEIVNNNDTTKSSTKKECIKDTSNLVPEDFKEFDHMMPEPPMVVGIEIEPEPPPEEIIPQSETIFDVVEKMPEFPGGETKMMEYLKKEIKYPSFAKEENLEGTVYIRFVINENGDVIDPKILKTPHKVFDEPSINVIRRMPKWTPGEDRGKKVKVNITVPIRYKLNN